MADDRSLKDVIRFVDPSGDMSDADIAEISRKLKFTEVLDLITKVGEDDIDGARNILAKYDDRFNIAKEYSNAKPGPGSSFAPIKPVGSSPTMARTNTNPNSQKDDNDTAGQELDTALQDPANKNRPEVTQIQNLLQRMKR
jgi:hypothetical protein